MTESITDRLRDIVNYAQKGKDNIAKHTPIKPDDKSKEVAAAGLQSDSKVTVAKAQPDNITEDLLGKNDKGPGVVV